jgi:hypothetical protein
MTDFLWAARCAVMDKLGDFPHAMLNSGHRVLRKHHAYSTSDGTRLGGQASFLAKGPPGAQRAYHGTPGASGLVR